MKGLCFVALGFVLSSSVLASYEHLLLPRAGNSSVARFDPINRVFLGTVGAEGGTQTSSANLLNNNSVYITGAGTTRYNLSTGAEESAIVFPVGLTAFSPSKDFLFEVFGNIVYRYTSGGVNGGGLVVPGGLSIASMVPLSDSLAACFGTNSAGDFVTFTANFGNSSFSAASVLMIQANFGGITSIGTGFLESSVSTNSRLWIPFFTQGNTVARRLEFNPSGQFVVSSPTLRALTGYTIGAHALVPGHTGFWAIGDDGASASTTRITRINGAFTVTGSYTTSQVDTPSSRFVAANVVAPEPATLAALGLGALALLRLRQKRA